MLAGMLLGAALLTSCTAAGRFGAGATVVEPAGADGGGSAALAALAEPCCNVVASEAFFASGNPN